MDIEKISVVTGQHIEFISLIPNKFQKGCQYYIDKCGGPSYIYKEKNEKKPIEYVKEAFQKFENYKNDILMVIDASSTKGFLEPSQASLYGQALGLRYAQCFDVNEACNGFARAAKIAYQTFQMDENFENKYILVINNEHPPQTRPVQPEHEKNYKQMASYYVGLSFSQLCCLTLLKKSDNFSWQFMNDQDTIYASHINIPLPNIAEGYLPSSDVYSVELNEQYGQFCIPKLHQLEEKAIKVLDYIQNQIDFFENANVICHTLTKTSWEQMFKLTKVKQLSLTYNETGNLGSASLPFILYQQYGEVLPKGEKIAFLGVGAGGSGVVLSFESQSNDQNIKRNINTNILQKNNQQKGIGYLKYKVLFIMIQRYIRNTILCQRPKKNRVIEGQVEKNK